MSLNNFFVLQFFDSDGNYNSSGSLPCALPPQSLCFLSHCWHTIFPDTVSWRTLFKWIGIRFSPDIVTRCTGRVSPVVGGNSSVLAHSLSSLFCSDQSANIRLTCCLKEFRCVVCEAQCVCSSCGVQCRRSLHVQCLIFRWTHVIVSYLIVRHYYDCCISSSTSSVWL
jgi:hypothetical protein